MTPQSKFNAGRSGVGLFSYSRMGTYFREAGSPDVTIKPRVGAVGKQFDRSRILILVLWLAVQCFAAISGRAAMQFDVFLGYDGVVPEATWFPLLFEIKNDGPSFNGMVELTSENMNQGQARRMVVELPTASLKRFVRPVFSTSYGYITGWDGRMLVGAG